MLQDAGTAQSLRNDFAAQPRNLSVTATGLVPLRVCMQAWSALRVSVSVQASAKFGGRGGAVSAKTWVTCVASGGVKTKAVLSARVAELRAALSWNWHRRKRRSRRLVSEGSGGSSAESCSESALAFAGRRFWGMPVEAAWPVLARQLEALRRLLTLVSSEGGDRSVAGAADEKLATSHPSSVPLAVRRLVGGSAFEAPLLQETGSPERGAGKPEERPKTKLAQLEERLTNAQREAVEAATSPSNRIVLIEGKLLKKKKKEPLLSRRPVVAGLREKQQPLSADVFAQDPLALEKLSSPQP